MLFCLLSLYLDRHFVSIRLAVVLADYRCYSLSSTIFGFLPLKYIDTMPSDVLQYIYSLLSKGDSAMTDNITTTAEQTTQPQSDMLAQDELTPFEKKRTLCKKIFNSDYIGLVTCFITYLFIKYILNPNLSEKQFDSTLFFFALLALVYLLYFLIRKCKFLFKNYKFVYNLFWGGVIIFIPILSLYIYNNNLEKYFFLVFFLVIILLIFIFAILNQKFYLDKQNHYLKYKEKEE